MLEVNISIIHSAMYFMKAPRLTTASLSSQTQNGWQEGPFRGDHRAASAGLVPACG